MNNKQTMMYEVRAVTPRNPNQFIMTFFNLNDFYSPLTFGVKVCNELKILINTRKRVTKRDIRAETISGGMRKLA